MWIRSSVVVIASSLALVATAGAGIRDTDDCRRNIEVAYSSLGQSAGQVQKTSGSRGEDSCMAYRRHFVDIVKARAAAAMCKTGPEREQDLGRLDDAVERINAGIAERCG